VTTVYLAVAILDQLDRAQAVIDRHLIACTACGTSRPCDQRRDAERVFSRYGRLPRRRPGVIGARVFTSWRGGMP